MREIILIKNGELALKGLNRATFESVLVKNIKRRLHNLGRFVITRSQSTITIEPTDEGFDVDEAVDRLGRVFGIAAFQRACETEKSMDAILRDACAYLGEELSGIRAFKVESKRSDKTFPLTSPEISREVGGALLARYPHLRVDVHRPERTVTVEVREHAAFIHCDQIKGAGGMPVGTGGKAMLLISGGIDSPVAGWMMAKRGIVLDAVHFASPPYTSPQSEQKVHDLLGQVARYSGDIGLYTVPFTEIQEQIRDNCPEALFTLVMRRFMMRIAERIARRESCAALITGESVGQVASQTILALGCTDAAAALPVFRPLIGMDKDEIIRRARHIETFDISIRPYEDCCTVFTPRHPRTRPSLPLVEAAEQKLDVEALVSRAAKGAKFELIRNDG